MERRDLAELVKKNATQIMIFLPHSHKFVAAENKNQSIAINVTIEINRSLSSISSMLQSMRRRLFEEVSDAISDKN